MFGHHHLLQFTLLLGPGQRLGQAQMSRLEVDLRAQGQMKNYFLVHSGRYYN